MKFEVGDKIHHFLVTPGAADTEVEDVGRCNNPHHANAEGGSCGEETITVTDPTTQKTFIGHATDFVKVDE